MVRYRRVNQWRVYIPKVRKIQFLVFVQFDETFSYYDTNYKVIDKDDNGTKLGNV